MGTRTQFRTSITCMDKEELQSEYQDLAERTSKLAMAIDLALYLIDMHIDGELLARVPGLTAAIERVDALI